MLTQTEKDRLALLLFERWRLKLIELIEQARNAGQLDSPVMPELCEKLAGQSIQDCLSGMVLALIVVGGITESEAPPLLKELAEKAKAMCAMAVEKAMGAQPQEPEKDDQFKDLPPFPGFILP